MIPATIDRRRSLLALAACGLLMLCGCPSEDAHPVEDRDVEDAAVGRVADGEDDARDAGPDGDHPPPVVEALVTVSARDRDGQLVAGVTVSAQELSGVTDDSGQVVLGPLATAERVVFAATADGYADTVVAGGLSGASPGIAVVMNAVDLELAFDALDGLDAVGAVSSGVSNWMPGLIDSGVSNWHVAIAGASFASANGAPHAGAIFAEVTVISVGLHAPSAVPGDFSSSSLEGAAATLGVAATLALQLETETGAPVELADGASALLTFPLGAGVAAAGATLGLWRLDASTATWVEVGTAEVEAVGEHLVAVGSVPATGVWAVGTAYTAVGCAVLKVTDEGDQPIGGGLIQATSGDWSTQASIGDDGSTCWEGPGGAAPTVSYERATPDGLEVWGLGVQALSAVGTCADPGSCQSWTSKLAGPGCVGGVLRDRAGNPTSMGGRIYASNGERVDAGDDGSWQIEVGAGATVTVWTDVTGPQVAQIPLLGACPVTVDIVMPFPLETEQVPGGTFEMGCETPPCAPESLPVHELIIGTFSMSTYEVTLAEYRLCAGVDYCSPIAPGPGCPTLPEEGVPLGADGLLPASCVLWSQAAGLCMFVGMRLCTEAEWEYAARGGAEQRPYPWGADPATCAHANVASIGGGDPCPTTGLRKVGADLTPGAFGHHDLVGNAAEWVADWYGADYYAESLPNDPSGPAEGTERALRGGSYASEAGTYRAFDRGHADPETRDPTRGIRCCATP